MKKLVIISALALATSSVFASDVEATKALHPMKDGSTLRVFKDGKMVMEDSKGRPVKMKPGQVMEAKDGSKFMMVGNEVMRLELLRKEHGGN